MHRLDRNLLTPNLLLNCRYDQRFALPGARPVETRYQFHKFNTNFEIFILDFIMTKPRDLFDDPPCPTQLHEKEIDPSLLHS